MNAATSSMWRSRKAAYTRDASRQCGECQNAERRKGNEMKTQYYKTRMVMVALLFALLLSACADNAPRETMQAVKEQAEDAGFVVPPGAYALLNEAQQVVIFLAPVGTEAGTYYLAAIVDTQHVYLYQDAAAKFNEWGLQGKIFVDELITALKARGFTELSGSNAPTLIATLRLGWAYLRTQGAKALVATTKLGETIQMIVMPAGLISPAWCVEHPEYCESNEQ